MVESFCSRASPTRSREREREREREGERERESKGSSWRLGFGVRGGCAPCPPYIGGWPAPLAPPPIPRAAAPRLEWGESLPPLLEGFPRVSPRVWPAGPMGPCAP